jgi:hypothetical protein
VNKISTPIEDDSNADMTDENHVSKQALLWMLRSAGWQTRTVLSRVSSVHTMPPLRFYGTSHATKAYIQPYTGANILECLEEDVVDDGALGGSGRMLDKGVVALLLAQRLQALAFLNEAPLVVSGHNEL